MTNGPVSPLFLERYELKYLIPLKQVDLISRYIEPYCEMDYYSKISPDQFYTINSLYFDSPSLFFLRNKENAGPHRFNLRVRSYGDHPKPPYFFEVKHKVREFVKKKRARLETEDWAELFHSSEKHKALDAVSQGYLSYFLDLAMTYNAEPQLLTQYRRKAYLSKINNYARVTFDRDLRFQFENSYNVVPDGRRMCHYDHPDAFMDTGRNVILELKCERKIPLWFIDLIQRFELTQTSFSKYCNAMTTAFGDEDEKKSRELVPAF